MKRQKRIAVAAERASAYGRNFCCDDLRASQLTALCKPLGLAVPDDVAVLGVDDDPIYCMFSTPRLSSIDPDATAIGKAAAETLAQMMEDAEAAASSSIV